MTRPASIGIILLFVLGGLLGFACAQADSTTSQGFVLKSSAFEDGARIPDRFGCGPERDYNKPSIPLEWSGVPEGTKSLVLLMDDPAPVAKYWVHWIVVNLPADTRALSENASATGLPGSTAQLENSFGDTAYGGPCPPDTTHTYRFQMFAFGVESVSLDTTGKRGDALTKELNALKPLGVATLSGDFPKLTAMAK
jgi:Raf kinase inhibitor-like YbhB/YbcL family protein